jgi:hypothetical protein
MFFVASVIPASAADAYDPHPDAITQRTSWGQQIQDLEFDSNGKLIAGYGDWTANTGPITVRPLDVNTGVWGAAQTSVPTEAITTIRKFDGNLYIPWTDPKGGIWWSHPAGYTTNAGGWNEERIQGGFIHAFDVNKRGNVIWVVGSAVDEVETTKVIGGTAKLSTDGGKTWKRVYDFANNNDRDFERMYWIARDGAGNTYSQVAHSSIETDLLSLKFSKRGDVRASKLNKGRSEVRIEGKASSVVEFKGMVLAEGLWADYYTIANNSYQEQNFPGAEIRDWYVDGGTLYALDQNQTVWYTTDGFNWSAATTAPAGALVLAHRNGTFYYGGAAGTIWRG